MLRWCLLSCSKITLPSSHIPSMRSLNFMLSTTLFLLNAAGHSRRSWCCSPSWVPSSFSSRHAAARCYCCWRPSRHSRSPSPCPPSSASCCWTSGSFSCSCPAPPSFPAPPVSMLRLLFFPCGGSSRFPCNYSLFRVQIPVFYLVSIHSSHQLPSGSLGL